MSQRALTRSIALLAFGNEVTRQAARCATHCHALSARNHSSSVSNAQSRYLSCSWGFAAFECVESGSSPDILLHVQFTKDDFPS